MMKTIMWKPIITTILAVVIALTTATMATAAPNKVNTPEPTAQLIDANLQDQRYYHTITGTVSVEHAVAKTAPVVQLQVGNPVKTTLVTPTVKETRNKKIIYTFNYIVMDKKDVAKEIMLKAGILKADGTVELNATQEPLVLGGNAGEVALGTANVDVIKDVFNWNTDTATAKIVTKLTKLRTIQVFYQTNETKTWKTVPAVKVATENGMAIWTVEMPVTGVTTQVKVAVAYKLNGKTMIDNTNQDAWIWNRE